MERSTGPGGAAEDQGGRKLPLRTTAEEEEKRAAVHYGRKWVLVLILAKALTKEEWPC